MARCTATPPCNYKLNGEVHDPGCPQRAAGIADPVLAHLYATETPDERDRLDEALDHLLVHYPHPDADADPDDVTGGEPEWRTIRQAIRDGASLPELCDLVDLRWDTRDHFTPCPALHVRDQLRS